MADEIVIPDIDEEAWDKAGSKFPTVGNHLVECTACEVKEAGRSLRWSFEITGGNDKGKTGDLYSGLSKDGFWKTKDILNALGVSYKFGDKGVSFDPGKALGAKGVGVWIEAKDTRSAEEGGKGTVYSKLDSILPAGSEVES